MPLPKYYYYSIIEVLKPFFEKLLKIFKFLLIIFRAISKKTSNISKKKYKTEQHISNISNLS